MPRRSDRIHDLARGRVRMSMNKLNLFNLYKKTPLQVAGKTHYQQKYYSKQDARSYHGEHIQERRFKAMYNPSRKSFAQLDASLKGGPVKETPLSLQSFALLEKRLEIALFRAMFASSVRQARQFIMSGNVKVNGVVIKHCSYPLQSGDIFSVNPVKVLYALGKAKPGLEQALEVDQQQIQSWNQYVEQFKANPQDELAKARANPDDFHSSAVLEELKNRLSIVRNTINSRQDEVTLESIFVDILDTAKKATETVGAEGAGKVNKETFAGSTQRLSRFSVYEKLAKANHPLLDKFDTEEVTAFLANTAEKSDNEKALLRSIRDYLTDIQKAEWAKIRKDPEFGGYQASELANNLQPVEELDKDQVLENESSAKIDLPWQKGIFGRQDPTKPYFTPWKPRGFLGCFAILPHHIEISFETCHAVYLRDPIARPGHSEVITPFDESVHERAHMYYRRKVPRWETEEWCTKLSELLVIGLKNTKDEIRIVDACTGTGCIPLLLNHELSQAGFKTDIHGFDVSGKAYDLAMENLSRVHGQADGNVTFQLGDVFNARVLEQIGVTKPVDLITANPPYIPIEEYEKPLYHQGIERSVKLYEPKLALVGDWEFYYNLLEHVVLPSHAKGFVFELGYQEQADFVHKYLKDNPFWQVGSRDDSRQNIRCVIGWKKGTDYEILQKLCDFIY
ncbi:uncharacterized protein J8A68_000606 [[Candida] subhashii]|uniref:Small ribosomal subunit protein uS4m n=1 Tax=[Candida] subhashii TaxID=561895 RepID=A0A8J5QJB9_9ASCO|nr:uncharacterized protein J8A68_000606 [[Candida] subhashii]KAG7665781.1 hypothetical protein J8A68_000606 [[Candida] subhashii]